MKNGRAGLSPAKLIVIYVAAAVLVIVHQADGLAGWLEDLARSGQSSFHASLLNLSADLRQLSSNVGLSRLNQAESDLLSSLTPRGVVGQKDVDSSPASLSASISSRNQNRQTGAGEAASPDDSSRDSASPQLAAGDSPSPSSAESANSELQTAQSDQPDPSSQTTQSDQTAQSGQPDQSDQTAQSSQTTQSDQPGQSSQPDQPGQTAQSDQPAQPGQTAQSDFEALSEKWVVNIPAGQTIAASAGLSSLTFPAWPSSYDHRADSHPEGAYVIYFGEHDENDGSRTDGANPGDPAADSDVQIIALSPRPTLPTSPPETLPETSGDAPIFNVQEKFKRVLLAGDSMMLDGLGPPLERHFKAKEGLFVTRQGRYSTGLCRLDYFDWLAYFPELLSSYEPDLVIITIGANDTQDIVLEGRKRHLVGSDGWKETYAQRVGELLLKAAEANSSVLWLGLPIMGREPYNSRVKIINEVAQTVCEAAPNCFFWDSTRSLTKDGQYSAFATSSDGRHVKVRQKDSIHLTEAGGKIMLADLLKDLPFLDSLGDPPAPAPSADEPEASVSAGESSPPSASVAAPGDAPTDASAQTQAPNQSQNHAQNKALNQAQNQAESQAESAEETPFPPAAGSRAEGQIRQTPASGLPFILSETTLLSSTRGQTRYLTAVPSGYDPENGL
ncbi:MAG: DUF459 domain-containing protein, partial [Deltaproteobacteria bacterium]|nr:DUF459 domain-containing protein [Deltaproteobacteria bacterium]